MKTLFLLIALLVSSQIQAKCIAGNCLNGIGVIGVETVAVEYEGRFCQTAGEPGRVLTLGLAAINMWANTKIAAVTGKVSRTYVVTELQMSGILARGRTVLGQKPSGKPNKQKES